MTKQEQNQIIKDALVNNLQKETEIPNDIGEIYKNWVLGKVQEASAQLQQQQAPAQPAEEQGGQEAAQE